jgi:hypothetical protein
MVELKQYHQPSDKLEASWNLDGMMEDAKLDLSTPAGSWRRRMRCRPGTRAMSSGRRAARAELAGEEELKRKDGR